MTIKFWRMGGMEWEKRETKFVFGVGIVIFAPATSLNHFYCEHQKQIFAGSLAVHTGFDGVATIQSLPALFYSSPKSSDR